MSQTYTDLWVCTDCMLERETGEIQLDADCTPWSLRPFDPINVTMSTEYSPETGEPIEGHREFDTSSCDGCGSTLAGERWRYAEWDN